MMIDLSNKANNEKYYKSIRYFSHALKDDKRRAFISELAEYNIYLAAQCVMSAEKDEVFEKSLIEKSEIYAKDFNNPEKSANGFLALAEFECPEIISSLFSNIQTPASPHLQVIGKILESKTPDVFCSFLLIFSQTNKPILIQFAVNSYSGDLQITNSNKHILKSVFQYLIKNKIFGLLSIIIEKYNLFSDFYYILEEKVEDVIRQISNLKITGIKLAYRLAVENNLIESFTPEYFIKKALDSKGKGSITFAISIALEHNIRIFKDLDIKIEKYIDSGRKNDAIQIKKTGKDIILKYILDNNKNLYDKVLIFFNKIDASAQKKYQETHRAIKENLPRKDNFYIYLINSIHTGNSSIEEIFDIFFSVSNKNFNISFIIEKILSKYDTDLIKLSHILRKYEIEGNVKHILEYGCYIQPIHFKASKLFFLHKDQITDKKEINHPEEILSTGNIIKFRIIGVNQQNFRLNVSCLKIFNPNEVIEG